MPTETETFLDETYTSDFEAPVESVSNVELEHAEVIERAFEHSVREETRLVQVIEPERIMLEEKRGGSAESWAREATGERKYFFDGAEAFNKETGGTLRDEMTRGVESGAYNIEELQRYDEMMKQWQESGSSTYFLPDRIERTENMEIRHVWYYVRHENGDVNWEAWKIETPLNKAEPDALQEIGPDEIPTISQYELESLRHETELEGGMKKVDEQEMSAEAQNETREQKEAQTDADSHVEFEKTTLAVPDMSKEEPPTGAIDESWLSSFLAYDTLHDIETPTPVAIAETPTHEETTPEFQAVASKAEKRDALAQESFIPKTQTERPSASTIENVTPPKEGNKEIGLREVRESVQESTVTVSEATNGSKNEIETAHAAHKLNITESLQEIHVSIENPIAVESEKYTKAAGTTEVKAGFPEQVLAVNPAPTVRESVTESTQQNELVYRRNEKAERPLTVHENNVVHVEDYKERDRSVAQETSHQEKKESDSRVDMLAYALGVHSPRIRATQTSQETRTDTRASIRATRPHEPVAPAKRSGTRAHTLNGITLRKAA